MKKYCITQSYTVRPNHKIRITHQDRHVLHADGVQRTASQHTVSRLGAARVERHGPD